MPQGFSGGFFLPAQRSVHCQGGFFSSAPLAGGKGATSSKAPFPVLFTLPHVPPTPANDRHDRAAATTGNNPKPRGRRVYDPNEGDEDIEVVDGGRNQRPPLEPEIHEPLQRSASTATRVVRGHSHLTQQKRPTDAETRASSSRSNNSRQGVTRTRPRYGAGQTQQEDSEAARPEKGDINTKFEIAMKELNQIKDEFDLKHQRQHSAPILPVTHGPSVPKPGPQSKTMKSSPPTIVALSQNQQPETPQDPTTSEQAPVRNMQSPRQRLQVAEMVMRKLYKKNLQTEQELATVKAEKEQLEKRLMADKGNTDSVIAMSSVPIPTEKALSATPAPCQRCQMNSAVGFVLANPPSLDAVSRIDQQQLEYLRHLAAEQDRTITSLKLRIEELSSQVANSQKQHLTTSKSTGGVSKSKSSTPRQAVTKLQSKLQEALSESERQKANYLKLKRDFQHLLALKTKTLYDNPTQLSASARELVALMDKQLKQLEADHSVDLSLYNSKLYESEQQSCESYAQQRLLEEEMDRVARDVQQRDALDVEIEQCMANVFKRLHHVESENVHLKQAIIATHSPAI